MRRDRGAVAIAALAVLAGCGGGSETAGQRAAATETPAARLDLGVVGVTARIGGDVEESAGIVLDADRGLILTTAHSVWGAQSLKVATGIAVLHGRIVARDSCDDLAVLETQPRLPGLVGVPPSSEPAPSTAGPIVAVRRAPGLPSQGQPDLSTQRVALGTGSAPPLLRGLADKDAVALRGDVLPATSTGAPLIGVDGRLVGMAQVVERPRRTVRRALPWAAIEARFGELEPGDRAQYVGWRKYYRCSSALHRYVAARHPRYERADAQLNAPVPATRLPGTEGVDR